MKSGIYLGKNSIEIRETDIPTVGDNDVLIKNIYSSICGTDVAVYNHGPNTGHKIDVDGEFGHETVSKVVRIGKNVKDFLSVKGCIRIRDLSKRILAEQVQSAVFRNIYLLTMQ